MRAARTHTHTHTHTLVQSVLMRCGRRSEREGTLLVVVDQMQLTGVFMWAGRRRRRGRGQ